MWYGATDHVSVEYKGKVYDGVVKRMPPKALHAWMSQQAGSSIDESEQEYEVIIPYENMSGEVQHTTITAKAKHMKKREAVA